MAYVAIAAAALAVVGGVVQGYAQKQQAEAQADAIKDQGRQDLEGAYAEERAQRRRFAVLQGQARSGIGKSGSALEGSPLELLAQNAAESEVEALAIRTFGINAKKRANTEASNLRQQGKLALYSGIIGGLASGAGVASGTGLLGGSGAKAPAASTPRGLTLPPIAYQSGRPIQPYRVP